MESIKVTTENLTSAAGKIESMAGTYQQNYGTLLDKVNALTSSDWTGEDATAFCQQVEGFREDFNKMKELMDDYATFLRNAARNYEETQARIKASAQSLQN